MTDFLPYFAQGTVVKGFGRGSKQLGIPTANYPQELVDKLPNGLVNGVYYGWAQVDSGPVYMMVMSLGWNPFYQNEKRSMETHILHKFKEDFYGQYLKTMTVGYIRKEKNFDSVDDLIAEIKTDISIAKEHLEKDQNTILTDHNFFSKL